jgi:hypothetical protein
LIAVAAPAAAATASDPARSMSRRLTALSAGAALVFGDLVMAISPAVVARFC